MPQWHAKFYEISAASPLYAADLVKKVMAIPSHPEGFKRRDYRSSPSKNMPLKSLLFQHGECLTMHKSA
ncbi:hypothetical protein AMTR_s00098p00070780 [Amborella trichopoda]|uniref:Uncharacterized protein n=1 Tax=Amborella trichopoda TaxID=13333 RepID=W1NWW3_AMBTC|nr:hypothetical protein AMTR_s00098p00070780 [Amborella trichopoda]